jgi:outer membrane protein TolC
MNTLPLWVSAVVGVVLAAWPGQGAGGAVRIVTLDQALALAAAHSPVLKAARHDVQAAEAQRAIAASAFLPKIEISESFTNTNNPSQAFATLLNQGRFTSAGFDITTLNRPGAVENYRSAVNVVQPLFNGGKERLGAHIASLEQAVSQEHYEGARQRVTFAVTRAYHDLVMAKAVRSVALETVQIAEADLKQIQSRFSSGAAVKSDLLQAQVRLASVREEAIRAEQAVRIAQTALRHAIGLDEDVDASDELSPVAAPIVDLESALAGAMESRPDYRALAVEVQRMEAETQLAKSAYLPHVNVQGSFEHNSTAPLGPNGQSNYSVFGVVSLNLFNGLGDLARVRKLRAQLDKARELLEVKRREIEVEVAEAYYSVSAARERVAVSESAVVQAEEHLRIVRNRYVTGLSPVLDLLTAELVLNQAKLNRLRALYDERISRARLDLVTGRKARR